MQERAGNIILGIAGPGERFTIRYGPFRFRLKIRPLTAKQLIKISREVSKIADINEEGDMFSELMQHASDTYFIARTIAIATDTRLTGIITRAIMRLPLKDIKTLFSIVRKQSDPAPFFFITILAKGRVNLLKQEH